MTDNIFDITTSPREAYDMFSSKDLIVPKVTRENYKKLQTETQLLTCLYCNQYYKNPRVLPCLHIYCTPCIGKMSTMKDVIYCGICCESFKIDDINEIMEHVPYKDMVNLKNIQDNLKADKNISCENCSFLRVVGETGQATVYCCDCKASFCEKDRRAHDKYTFKHRIEPLQRVKNELNLKKLLSNITTIKCSKHQNNEMQYYCLICKDKLCETCALVDHHSHKKELLSNVINVYSSSVDKRVEEFGNPMSMLKKEINECEVVIQNFEKDKINNLKIIKDDFDDIIQKLETKKKAMIEEVTDWYQDSVYRIRKYIDTISKLCDKILCLGDFVSTYSEYPNCYKVELSAVIEKRIGMLIDQQPKTNIRPVQLRYSHKNDRKNLIKESDLGGKLKFSLRPDFKMYNDRLTRKELNLDDNKDIHGLCQSPNGEIAVVYSNKNERKGEKYDLDTFQFFNHSFGKERSVEVASMLKSPMQVILDKNAQLFICDRERKQINIYDSMSGKFLNYIQYGQYQISDFNSIAVTLNGDLVVHSKNELKIFEKESKYAQERSISPFSNTLRRSDSVLSIPPTRFGNTPKTSKKTSDTTQKTPSVETTPRSVTLAINSNNLLYVASDEKPIVNVFDLDGKEIDTLNFADAAKKIATELDTKKQNSDNRERQISPNENRRPRSIIQVGPNSPSTKKTFTKSSETLRNAPKGGSSPPPQNTSKKTKTLIMIDFLNNIYVYQKRGIYIYNQEHTLTYSSYLHEDCDPLSMHISKYGHFYIFTEKSEIMTFPTQLS